MTRRCSCCKQTLPVEMFGPNRAAPDGIRNECKPCRNRKAREVPHDHPTRIKMRERLRSLPFDHPKRIKERERSRAKYWANREAAQREHRKQKLRREYGLTVEQFDAMFAAQDGRCAICDTDDFQGKRPHIDHCHETGVVRGLLCVRCNQGLGNFVDSPDRMRAGIAYLERFLESLKARAA